MIHKRPIAYFAALLILTFLAGCGKSGPGATDSGSNSIGVEAVYRADANVYGRATMKASEFAFGDLENEADRERFDAFTEATGLSESDILEVVICGVVTNLSIDDLAAVTDVESLPLNIAFSLAKPVTYEQFKAGMAALEDDPDSEFLDQVVAGTKVMKMIPSDDAKPETYGALSSDGQTAYLAFNLAELGQTLATEQAGTAQAISADLHAAYTNLAESAHMRVGILIPDSVREGIRAQIDDAKEEAGPLGGILMGVYEPFAKLQSLGLAMYFTTNVVLDVVGDMADAENATKAKAGMTVITGMIQGMLLSGEDAPSINLGTAMQSTAEGRFLKLNINLPEEEMGDLTP